MLFLLYHYFNAREIYNAIRVFIAGYVWMTGYGNFMYYYHYKDFCLGRCGRRSLPPTFVAHWDPVHGALRESGRHAPCMRSQQALPFCVCNFTHRDRLAAVLLEQPQQGCSMLGWVPPVLLGADMHALAHAHFCCEGYRRAARGFTVPPIQGLTVRCARWHAGVRVP